MQAAKKLVLVDEFDREYKHLRRPAAKVAKTDQSLQFSNTLRDQSIADNRKVREYVTALHTYLNVRKEVPAESAVEPIPGTYTQNSPHHHPCEDDDTDDNDNPLLRWSTLRSKSGSFGSVRNLRRYDKG